MIYNQNCISGIVEYIKDNSIDLIVTSPPYKEQDGFSWLLIKDVAKQSFRILKDNSLCFINFGHLARFKSRPFKVALEFEKVGFEWVDTIMWVKNHYSPVQGDKRVNNITEFIFMFAKGKNYHLDRLSIGVPYADKSNVGRYSDIDLKCRGNTWSIPYATIRRKDEKLHKDRFPVELPLWCIKLSGIKKDSVVLDPFGGSMTTGVACEELGMRFVGFEINEEVYQIGRERLLK
ncbi:MAG: site-specific DNA-methyltransferase [Methanofastidiosum sp.]